MPRSKGPRSATTGGRAPVPRRRARLDVEERRAQLIEVALTIFSGRAYDDVSIDDIALAAGISKGLLYHYYASKRELYVAALESAAQRLLEETSTDTSVPPALRVHLGLNAYLDFVERHRVAFVALMRGGIGSDHDVSRILEQTRRTFVERIVEDLPRVVDVPMAPLSPLLLVALKGYIGFVEAASISWAEDSSVPKERMVELLASMLLNTLATTARSS